jgi:hypothetical protein
MLFAHVTSALYLLEHASWSYLNSVPKENQWDQSNTGAALSEEAASAKHEHDIDVEVFVRWVEEFGLQKAIMDVEAVWEFGNGKEREWVDSAIVYGSERAAGSEFDGSASVRDKAKL